MSTTNLEPVVAALFGSARTGPARQIAPAAAASGSQLLFTVRPPSANPFPPRGGCRRERLRLAGELHPASLQGTCQCEQAPGGLSAERPGEVRPPIRTGRC